MAARNKPIVSPEQQRQWRSVNAIDELAEIAGFDHAAYTATEFSLYPLFDLIVEECAKVVESETGCKHSAEAIRNYGKMIGNQE